MTSAQTYGRQGLGQAGDRRHTTGELWKHNFSSTAVGKPIGGSERILRIRITGSDEDSSLYSVKESSDSWIMTTNVSRPRRCYSSKSILFDANSKNKHSATSLGKNGKAQTDSTATVQQNATTKKIDFNQDQPGKMLTKKSSTTAATRNSFTPANETAHIDLVVDHGTLGGKINLIPNAFDVETVFPERTIPDDQDKPKQCPLFSSKSDRIIRKTTLQKQETSKLTKPAKKNARIPVTDIIRKLTNPESGRFPKGISATQLNAYISEHLPDLQPTSRSRNHLHVLLWRENKLGRIVRVSNGHYASPEFASRIEAANVMKNATTEAREDIPPQIDSPVAITAYTANIKATSPPLRPDASKKSLLSVGRSVRTAALKAKKSISAVGKRNKRKMKRPPNAKRWIEALRSRKSLIIPAKANDNDSNTDTSPPTLTAVNPANESVNANQEEVAGLISTKLDETIEIIAANTATIPQAELNGRRPKRKAKRREFGSDFVSGDSESVTGSPNMTATGGNLEADSLLMPPPLTTDVLPQPKQRHHTKSSITSPLDRKLNGIIASAIAKSKHLSAERDDCSDSSAAKANAAACLQHGSRVCLPASNHQHSNGSRKRVKTVTSATTNLQPERSTKNKERLLFHNPLIVCAARAAADWNADQVSKFISDLGFSGQAASVFREQEIDGVALLLMSRADVLSRQLSIKIGPALKLYEKIRRLQLVHVAHLES